MQSPNFSLYYWPEGIFIALNKVIFNTRRGGILPLQGKYRYFEPADQKYRYFDPAEQKYRYFDPAEENTGFRTSLCHDTNW